MRRRYQWHWWDPVFLALAALIVFPDRLLNWISERTGKAFNWLHFIAIELVAISVVITLGAYIGNTDARFAWWHPWYFVWSLAGFRAIYAFLHREFD